jgi:iron complex outermembrane receptor protein
MKLKRSRTERAQTPGTARRVIPLASAIAGILAGPPATYAADNDILQTVVVTAQKRTESIQDVPLSIQAIGSAQLEQLHVTQFEDYVKYLPSVTFQTFGPGFSRAFMRGVASGDTGNHSGPQPSVAVYLDEQPITTITGELDVHLYDIARVESLSGPQGTLYGASSQAGTIRIITNKPDPKAFESGYDVEGNTLSGGGSGYIGQAFVNVPLSDNTAIRLVGWSRHDAGYIDNVNAPREYQSNGLLTRNTVRPQKDYNDVDTYGARAALKIDLNDRWTITPQLMAQEQKANGSFSYDPSIGDLKVAHVAPEESRDRWGNAALTVEGKIGNFDLVYAGSFLDRKIDGQSDYADYAYHYDAYYFAGDPDYSFASVFVDDNGDQIDPAQFIKSRDRFERFSHEVRLSSPQDWRTRFVVGAFVQRQQHGIEQRYLINDLTSDFSVVGWPDTIWLTEQTRTDRDKGVFGEVSYDLTDQLTATGGLRYYDVDNSLAGYFGLPYGYSSSGNSGEALCTKQGLGLADGDDIPDDDSTWAPYHGATGTAPCTNLDRTVKESGTVHKLNLAYKFDPDHMVYATFSKGFRPGGVNRRGTFPPYKSDFLKNYELGWKTQWAGNRVRFNGAVFVDDWDNFQFSYLGANGLTNIQNAGQARIKGVELDTTFAVTEGLLLSAGATWINAELTENFCRALDANGPNFGDCGAFDAAPKGTRLPITPKFKANAIARYSFDLAGFDAHAQAGVVYQTDSTSALFPQEAAVLGIQPSYTLLDLSLGFGRGNWTIEGFINNVTDERTDFFRFAQCASDKCGVEPYVGTNPPRTFGVKFGQKFE